MLIFTANRLSKLLSVGLSALLSCWLTACSSGADSGATASNSPVNPCSVLSGADFQMALGAAPVHEGKRDNMGLVDSCTWSLPSGGDISVSFYNAVGAATTYAPTLSSRRSRDKTYAPVSGVGSEAAFRDDSSPPGIAISKAVEVVQTGTSTCITSILSARLAHLHRTLWSRSQRPCWRTRTEGIRQHRPDARAPVMPSFCQESHADSKLC